MKNLKTRCCLLLILCIIVSCFVGCSQADRASQQISQQADNFNVLRQLTVINNMTHDTIYTMTGKFSINVDETENQLEVTVENEDGSYAKHFVDLNSMTTYTVVDLDSNYVNPCKFSINYNPDLWMPIEFNDVQ